jgi:hypothetical protein
VNTLPRELELLFGRELTSGGARVDITQGKAKYLKRADAEQFRLRFKDGKAYSYAWWDTNPSKALVLFDSSRAAEAGMHRTPIEINRQGAAAIRQYQDKFADYGSFVLSMSRGIYSTKHVLGNDSTHDGIYHSAYLAGEAVMAAGTMLVVNGVIQRVRSDSGHYMPKESSMVGLLRTFQMLRVPLEPIKVDDFKGLVEVDAIDFLKQNGDWDSLFKQRSARLADYQRDYSSQPEPFPGDSVTGRTAAQVQMAIRTPITNISAPPLAADKWLNKDLAHLKR